MIIEAELTGSPANNAGNAILSERAAPGRETREGKPDNANSAHDDDGDILNTIAPPALLLRK